jgi:hypothetical protein
MDALPKYRTATNARSAATILPIDVYMFVIAALIPCIPVVIAAIPFNVLMKVVMKLLV